MNTYIFLIAIILLLSFSKLYDINKRKIEPPFELCVFYNNYNLLSVLSRTLTSFSKKKKKKIVLFSD